MLTKLLLITLLTLCYYTGKSQGHNICRYRQEQFNSDTCCWRMLAKTDSFDKAASLIEAYLACTKNGNRHALYWHAGQMLAKANRYQEAKKYFHKTFNVFYKWLGGADGKAWYFYAKGTVAFLDNDPRKLHHIIRRWDKKLPKDINYQALLQLEANAGKPYKDATR
jgi:tetratricopeptide (TPR) repeat protein